MGSTPSKKEGVDATVGTEGEGEEGVKGANKEETGAQNMEEKASVLEDKEEKQKDLIEKAYCPCESTENRVEIKWYCTDCDKTSCEKCLANVHKTHNIEYIEEKEFIKARRDRLTEINDDLKDLLDKVTDQLGSIKSHNETLSSKREKCKEDLSCTYDELSKRMEERKDQEEGKLNEILGKRIEEMESTKERVEGVEERAKSLCRKIGDTLKVAPDSKLVLMGIAYSEEFKEIRKDFEEECEKNKESFNKKIEVEFRRSRLNRRLIDELNPLGRIANTDSSEEEDDIENVLKERDRLTAERRELSRSLHSAESRLADCRRECAELRRRLRDGDRVAADTLDKLTELEETLTEREEDLKAKRREAAESRRRQRAVERRLRNSTGENLEETDSEDSRDGRKSKDSHKKKSKSTKPKKKPDKKERKGSLNGSNKQEDRDSDGSKNRKNTKRKNSKDSDKIERDKKESSSSNEGQSEEDKESNKAKDARVIIVGMDQGNETLQKVSIVSLHSRKVQEANSLSSSILANEGAATVVDGSLYVSGLGEESRELWKYDPSGDEWKRLEDMRHSRRRHCMESIESEIYILGGWMDDTDCTLDDISSYSIEKDRWTNGRGRLTKAVRSAGSATYKKCIYLFGGKDDEGHRTDAVQVYSASSGRCRIISSLPRPSALLRAVRHKAKVIIIGRDTCYVYDILSRAWSERNAYSAGLSHFGLVITGDNRLFLLGGGSAATNEGEGETTWHCSDKVLTTTAIKLIDDKGGWKVHQHLSVPSLIQTYALLEA